MRSAWRQADGKKIDDTVEMAFEDEDAVMQADVWMVVHPMEFDGTVYNLFGGWNEDVYERVKRMLVFDGEMVSMERPMPDLQEILRPRADKTEWTFTDAEWSHISQRCRSMPYIEWEDERDNLVYGDSHSVAHFVPGYVVKRHDGLTLHGMLERRELWNVRTEGELVVCAGNIDVRHHFGRHTNDPDKFAYELVHELTSQLLEGHRAGHFASFKVVQLLPVEHEARRVPKTGWYKGEPFCMPRQDRLTAVKSFNKQLEFEVGFENVRPWPGRWYDLDGKVFADRYMEKPGSVHLSPRWHRWDYENEKLNLDLIGEFAS